MKTYFTLDEDFNQIIDNYLGDKKITDIRPISTGWTNIVYEVATDERKLFF